MANNQSTNTIIKSQSKDQQQIKYQFNLINISYRYSILLALKYNYEMDLLIKHTITPQIQISQNLGINSNVDFGLKYHYLNKIDNVYSNRQNIEYFLIGYFMQPQNFGRFRIENQNYEYVWSCTLYYQNKKYDSSLYFQINEIENKLNNKLKFF